MVVHTYNPSYSGGGGKSTSKSDYKGKGLGCGSGARFQSSLLSSVITIANVFDVKTSQVNSLAPPMTLEGRNFLDRPCPIGTGEINFC
jgi:hypothetical protein